MNCREFNEKLYDVLDGKLEAGAQSATREHLKQCNECRRAFAREQSVSGILRRSLDLATEGLALQPETRRKILSASEAKPGAHSTRSIWTRSWQWFAEAPVQPLGAAAAILAMVLLMQTILSHRRAAENSTPQDTAGAPAAGYVVDVPIPVETRVVRIQGNTIQDTTVSSMAFGHAVFPEPSKPQFKHL